MDQISWADFAGGYADDKHAANAIGDDNGALIKALSAGNGQAVADSAVSGAMAPIMPESLDNTLISLTYTEVKFPFWQSLTKSRAYNTAEEFNQLLKVGQGEAGFIGEGDLPEEEDSTYRRKVTLIKFMGVTRRVTHVGSLVRVAGIDSAIAAETRDGALWLMRILEESLFFGDSTIVPVQFDGLKKQLVDGGAKVYDLRGLPVTVKIINMLASRITARPYLGEVNTIYSSIGVKSDLVNDYLALMRTGFGDSVKPGLRINEIETQVGTIKVVSDIFIVEGQIPFSSGLGVAAKRPLTPLANGALTSPVAADPTTTKFAAGDVGAYIYKVVAVNRYGRSAPMTTAAVTPAAADEINIPVQDGGQGTTGYIVYRSTKDGAASTCKEAFRVARTGATQTLVDRNRDLPGTSCVFGLTMDSSVIRWKQLAPFTKIALATVDTSIRWMQVLYGALEVTAPRKNFLIKNVGRDPNSLVIDDDETVGEDGY